MKTRIARLSPRQNGVVSGVLTGAASLVLVVPAYSFMQAAQLVDPGFGELVPP